MKKLLLTLILLALFNISAKAQITKLVNFIGPNGAGPNGALISDGVYLYGTTTNGGANSLGNIFKMKPDGTGYVNLLDFNGTNGANPYYTKLIYDGGNYLYGITYAGGANNTGLIYKIRLDGSNYTKLIDLDGTTGDNPYGSLINDGTYLYVMTSKGGANNLGNIFKIKYNGTGYTSLLDFDGTNGANPVGSLVMDGFDLYGTATYQGANNNGTIFKLKNDGTGYVKLFDFDGATGGYPTCALVSDGTYLYGTTNGGGAGNLGVIFKIKNDGTGYTDMLDFNFTNGSSPYGSLIFEGTYLYGTTSYGGGTNGQGNIFKIKPDGTGFKNLAVFNNANGSGPNDELYYDGTSFYGTTFGGGTNNTGVVFKYTEPATSLNFDGVDDNAITGTSSALAMSNQSTIEAWFQTGSTNTMEIIRLNTLSDQGMELGLDGGQLFFNAYLGTWQNFSWSSGPNLSDSAWHHFAMVADGDSVCAFVDGVKAGTLMGSAPLNTGDASIVMGSHPSQANYFLGNLDEVRIWNRALCPSEIQNNMMGEVASHQNGLVAYYKFNQGLDAGNNTAILFAADSTGNGVDATLNNFALTGSTSNFIDEDTITAGNLVTPFISTVATQTNVTCYGNANGTASVAVSGAAAPFTYSWSPGNATGFAQGSLLAGNYTCTINYACGTTAQTFTITQPTQLMATATAGTINCNGAATTVTVSATGGTTAYTGDGTYTVTAGSYTYTVTDANNCASTTTISITQPNAITSAHSSTICAGASVTVGTHTYTTAGTYTDVLTAANGCDSTVTTHLSINVIDTSITITPAYFPILTVSATGATYQWVTCGTGTNTPIPGATQQSYTTTSNGLAPYAVIVTQGACSSISDCRHDAIIEGISKYNAANNLQVYPNPFSNELTIVSTAKTNAILFDVLGNKINEYVLQNQSQTISLGDLAPGMYYLQVDAQKIKIIKQ